MGDVCIKKKKNVVVMKHFPTEQVLTCEGKRTLGNTWQSHYPKTGFEGTFHDKNTAIVNVIVKQDK